MEKGQPCVSVLVPVYNVEGYLNECLDSLSRQTLKEIEIIAVDDGSSDASLDILNDYAFRDDRFKIVSQVNKGYGAAMNVALELATGKYVGIVEPDDYVSDEMYANLYQAAEQNKCDIVKSNRYDCRGEKMCFVELNRLDECGRIIRPIDEPFVFRKSPSTWTGIYRKAFLDECGIRYNETPGASYQDTGFAFKALVMSHSLFLLHDGYYHYRRDNDDSSSNSTKKVFAIREEYRLLREDLEKRGLWAEVSPLYAMYMLQSYEWSYSRVDWLYKFAFLIAFRDDFVELRSEGVLQEHLLGESRWAKLNFILEDPEQYFEQERSKCIYYQRIIQLTAQRDDALSMVDALRKSNSYRIGRLITFIPRKIKKLIKKARSKAR